MKALTFASPLKPFIILFFFLRYPSAIVNDGTAKVIKASFQAVKAMTSPAAIVAMFWIIRPKASPTTLRTAEASVDNLAPTAPLTIAK